MNKNREKKKFSIERKITCEEYQKYYKYLPSVFRDWLQQVSFYSIIFLLIIGMILQWQLIELVIAVIFFIIALSIYYLVKQKQIISDDYYERIKDGTLEEESTLDFYDTYFICSSLHYTVKLEYSKITKVMETDNHFYLFSDIEDFIILKRWCYKENYSFFRSIREDNFIDKRSDKDIRIPRSRKKMAIGKDSITVFLNILLVATLFSIYLAFYIYAHAVYKVPSALHVQYSWIYLLMLIIPVLSIVFGFKYRTVVKTKYNLIAGFILGGILLALACSYFIYPINEIDYSSVKKYQNILDISIPKKGYYYKDDETFHFLYDFDGILVSSVNAYYKDNEVSLALADEIKNNKSWIAYSDLGDIEKLLPYELRSDKYYYLIYNKTTKEYNSFPNKDGNYSFLISVYVPRVQQLEIYEYHLDYTK